MIDTCNIDILELLKLDQVDLMQTIPCKVKFERNGKVLEFDEPSPCVYCASINAGTVMAFFVGLLGDGDYVEIEYVQGLYQGHSLLHLSVMAQARDCVRILTTLNAGESIVNTPTDDGVLPLTIAIEKQNIDIILNLLEGGANAFLGDPCPLQIALEKAPVQVIEVMLNWLAANEMRELENWANTPIDGKMPGDYLESVGRVDIADRIRGYEREEEEEEEDNEEIRCQVCKNFDVRKCYICSFWYCPVHMRLHRHTVK